jgi:hypothetical protein
MAQFYPLLHELHFHFSRAALIVGLLMLAAGIYIGLIRHGDVTKTFRYGVYAMIGFMALQSLVGLAIYSIGVRPYDEVHLIYGVGALLSLPFFVYVETTAKKRPAMGSYIWGFGLMVAIMVRLFMTGAAG